MYDSATMLQIKNVDDDVDAGSTISSSCTNRNTDIQGAGSNEGRIYKLNKHDISCHSDEAIKRWQVITRRRRSWGARRRTNQEISVEVECCKDNDLFTDTRNVSTPTVSDKDGYITALWEDDIGIVECEKDEVMRQWKLNRPSDSTIRIDYQCAKAKYPLQCSYHRTADLYTTYGTDTQGGMIYLDRHNLNCDDGEYMQMWKVFFFLGSRVFLNYQCCSIQKP